MPDTESSRRAVIAFDNADRILTTGEGDLKSRLIDASREILYKVRREALPTEQLKMDFDWIVQHITSEEPIKRDGHVEVGQIEVSISRLKYSTLTAIEDRIHSINSGLEALNK